MPKDHRLTDHKKKPKLIYKQVWNEESIAQLQSCLDDTDWSVFFMDSSVNSQAESITGYLQYCVDQSIPTITVKQYLIDESDWTAGRTRQDPFL